jgi:large subunit ribosomal protein L11
MAKAIVAKIKLQAPGGQATPAPPVGPALGQYNISPGQFVSQFNERTKEYNGMPVPVVITVYANRTFSFITKSPPAAALLKEAAQIAKGSGVPNKEKAGTVTAEQVRQIAQKKIADLNARDLDRACRIIEGTARSMGITVVKK